MPAVSELSQRRSSRISAAFTWAYLAHLLLHVLVPPLLFLAPQLFSGHLADSGLHRPLIAGMLAASTLILSFGWRRHRNATVLWWGGVGGLCLFMATWVVDGLWGGHQAALIVGSVGSVLLAAAHWHNHKLWRRPAATSAD